MVVILFPFWVFLKLQLLVHFTNCFEEKNRPSWILSSGSVWASKESQLVNHQFILPRLRYTAEEDKTSTREFVYVAKTVSKIFKSYFRNKESCQLTARVGFSIELRVGMGPWKPTRRRKNVTYVAYQRLDKTTDTYQWLRAAIVTKYSAVRSNIENVYLKLSVYLCGAETYSSRDVLLGSWWGSSIIIRYLSHRKAIWNQSGLQLYSKTKGNY